MLVNLFFNFFEVFEIFWFVSFILSVMFQYLNQSFLFYTRHTNHPINAITPTATNVLTTNAHIANAPCRIPLRYSI